MVGLVLLLNKWSPHPLNSDNAELSHSHWHQIQGSRPFRKSVCWLHSSAGSHGIGLYTYFNLLSYLSESSDSTFFLCLNLSYSLNCSAAQQCVTSLCSHKNINVMWCEAILILHSVDEKYWVCQHVQGLKRELYHSAHSFCKYCIHFNSLCVKLNEFGFFASLVIVVGNKTRGKGITFPHLNFKCIKSLKQTKQKWLLKFIGEVMNDLNFQSIFWVCYKFFPNQECHVWLLYVFDSFSSAHVLGESRNNTNSIKPE